MSEMVERVARAIGNVLVKDSHGECLLIATDEQCTEIARAAIEAMREPTEGMKQSGAMVMPDYDPDVNDAAQCWEAMINEALK